MLQSRQVMKLKQEAFHVRIRREKTEDLFKQKRLAVMKANTEVSGDEREFITTLPQSILMAYSTRNITKLVLEMDSLTNLVRKYCYEAKTCFDRQDMPNYHRLESIVQAFFCENQELIEVILGFCQFKTLPSMVEEDGFIPFTNDNTYFIEPYQFQLCSMSFLILTNITYFSNQLIENYQVEFQKDLLRGQTDDNSSRTPRNVVRSWIMYQYHYTSNQMLYFFSNLLIDVNIKDTQLAQDICYDILCSSINTQMKLMLNQNNPDTQYNFRLTQIHFIRIVLEIDVPSDFQHFSNNILYFVQQAINIITDIRQKGLESALVILKRLSIHSSGLVSVATKAIWDNLIGKLRQLSLCPDIVCIFGNILCNNDMEISDTLIRMGLLDELDTVLDTVLPIEILNPIVQLLNNMLSTRVPSFELIDTVCKRLIRKIMNSYSEVRQQEQYLKDVAINLIELLKRIANYKEVTIVDLIFLLESEIIENLSLALQNYITLLPDFLEMMLMFKNSDGFFITEFMQRLDCCNSHQIIELCYNRNKTENNQLLDQLIQDYAEMICEWNSVVAHLKVERDQFNMESEL